MRVNLVQNVDHGGGAVSSIPDIAQNKDGGAEWCLRYACDGNNYAIQCASIVASFDYLISDNINMKEATRRLREMRAVRRKRKAEL